MKIGYARVSTSDQTTALQLDALTAEGLTPDVFADLERQSGRDAAIESAHAVLSNLRPLDAGGLSQATPIESFTAVLLQLNVHYKTRVAVRFTGIADAEAAS